MLPGRAAQVWRHQPAHRRPRHFHEETELNAVVRGAALIAVGNRRVEVSRGELIVFEPGQDHALLEASDDLELFVMALRPTLAARARLPRVLDQKISLGERDLFALRERALAVGEMRDAVTVERQVVELFAALDAHPSSSHASSRRALAALWGSPNLSANELARRLRIAPAQLSRQFHRDLGLRLVEHRARIRLIRFIRFVDQGASLSAAALDADFGSYAQCHRIFQRALGCSPRDYFDGARLYIDTATER